MEVWKCRQWLRTSDISVIAFCKLLWQGNVFHSILQKSLVLRVHLNVQFTKNVIVLCIFSNHDIDDMFKSQTPFYLLNTLRIMSVEISYFFLASHQLSVKDRLKSKRTLHFWHFSKFWIKVRITQVWDVAVEWNSRVMKFDMSWIWG